MASNGGDVVTFLTLDPGASDIGPNDVRRDVYKQAGVDTAEADAGLSHIVARVQRTWPQMGIGRVLLPIGYFANVIEMDGVGIALCTDGVGSFNGEIIDHRKRLCADTDHVVYVHCVTINADGIVFFHHVCDDGL